MVKLNILPLLEKKEMTRYQLWLSMPRGLNYKSFNRLINNETLSVKFEYLEIFCNIFECELFDILIRED